MLIFLYVLFVVLGFVAIVCSCKYAYGNVDIFDLIMSALMSLTILGSPIMVVIFMTSKMKFLDKRIW